MSTLKRTRLSPVYLTASERDLVRQAFATLAIHLEPSGSETVKAATVWAKSYTKQRIHETAALFKDPAPKAESAS